MSQGIRYYIDDLNLRFTNLLFTNKLRKFWGLARIDISGVPFINESGKYNDVLFDDRYDISSFYVLTGDENAKPYSIESKIDLIVTAKMTSFSGYTEDEIIEAVYEIMKVTPFGTGLSSVTRDMNAIKEFNYQEKIKETMHPYFVFRFKCRLLSQLKI